MRSKTESVDKKERAGSGKESRLKGLRQLSEAGGGAALFWAPFVSFPVEVQVRAAAFSREEMLMVIMSRRTKERKKSYETRKRKKLFLCFTFRHAAPLLSFH